MPIANEHTFLEANYAAYVGCMLDELTSLSLHELLSTVTPYSFRLLGMRKASWIMEFLISEHMLHHSDALLAGEIPGLIGGDATGSGSSMLEGMQSESYPPSHMDYDTEMARMANCLTREFLERFMNSDGSIDWVSLVDFSSRADSHTED